MDLTYLVLFILCMASATFLTRALPFWLLKDHQHPLILFLGRNLPPAVMTLLVLYSLKHVTWISGSYGLPEVSSLLLVTAIHLCLKNALLSIASGTVLYMLWVQGLLFG